jgi:hypothetical protein
MEIRPCTVHAQCDETFSTALSYINHMKLHDGSKSGLIQCPFVACEKRYVWTKSIMRHVQDEHNSHNYVMPPQDQEFSYTCLLPSCYFATLTSVKDMRLHLLGHTDKREAVSCPFTQCSKTYRFRTSLATHFSRKHKNANVLDVRGADIEMPLLNNSSPLHSDVFESPDSPPLLLNHLACFPAATSETKFSNALCDFYNIVMHEKKIPYSTLDYMIKRLISFQV